MIEYQTKLNLLKRADAVAQRELALSLDAAYVAEVLMHLLEEMPSERLAQASGALNKLADLMEQIRGPE